MGGTVPETKVGGTVVGGNNLEYEEWYDSLVTWYMENYPNNGTKANIQAAREFSKSHAPPEMPQNV